MYFQRFRRLRNNPIIREMVKETRLHTTDFIYPLFVVPGSKVKKPVNSMPGVFQMSIDNIVKECKEVYELGIPAVILFGIPEKKDPIGSDAYNDNGIIQKAIKRIKKSVPNLIVIGDICLCEYTSHGHCGVLHGEDILNDESIEIYGKIATAQANAGVDMVAPSDMMDGRIICIREALDKAGFINLPIMSYAAKYASGFYGPFREAAESAPAFGDRRSHQLDIANAEEAIREIEEDINEGADIVMVKPALSYLDIIRRVKSGFSIPIAAYQVSGEYSMIKAAAKLGWIDEERIMVETLTSIKRAGADMILTYFAKDIAKYLAKD